jgi:hypothetical protein
MPFGKQRGFSDYIRSERARDLLAAHEFAARIGRPLNVAVNLNWSKTTAGDDPQGELLRAFRKAAGRFLCEHSVGGLTCVWVRENPISPVARPNAHLDCHVPQWLFEAFDKAAHRFLPPGCDLSDPDAIWIDIIKPTSKDSRRRSEYLVKGVDPRARLEMNCRRIPQGRIHGKRCGTSEDIGRRSRARWAEQQNGLARPAHMIERVH